jgi:hypothetical protein
VVARNSEGSMQEQINRLAGEVLQLSKVVTTQTTTQKLNHEQNRRDIHDLRNGQQKFADALLEGFDKMAKSLDATLTPIRKDIFDLQMWKSKTTGYVLGLSALAALIFKLVDLGLSHAGMK